MLLKADAESPYKAFFYYHKGQLHAVRQGKWKLHLANNRKLTGLGNQRLKFAAALYDLDSDLGETKNLAADHPELVRDLTALAEKARTELGDDDHHGRGQRAAAHIEKPTGRVKP